jgi:hypothetical protein
MGTNSFLQPLSAALFWLVALAVTLPASAIAADDFSSKFKPRLGATPAPAAAAQATSLLALASDPFLVSVLYGQPKHLGSPGNATGAISVNAQWEKDGVTPWFIEQQRYGVDHVQAGVVLKNEASVETGLRVLNWGFARQGPDGDFPGTGDPIHSTSFFVEAAARSALLLQQSGVPAFEAKAKELAPKILAAARWIAKADVDPGKRKNNLDPYTHRFYLRAAGLGEAAALTGDKALARAAEVYAREGLSKQLPDGTNPEKGGFDVSYQMVGLNYAMCYYSVCSDAALRRGLKEMAGKALASALPRVNPDGTVSLEGSTRVGQEKGRSGTTKTLDYKNMLQGLIFADRLIADPRFRDTAQRLAKGAGWLPR